MVVWVDDIVLTLFTTHQLQCQVGQHFVGVHVDGGTGATLKYIDRELVQTATFFQHQIARLDDVLAHLFGNGTQFGVGHSRSFFGQYHATDEFWRVVNGAVADLKVLHCPQGVHAVVSICRNFHSAE